MERTFVIDALIAALLDLPVLLPKVNPILLSLLNPFARYGHDCQNCWQLSERRSSV